jgi:hypothetical protein
VFQSCLRLRESVAECLYSKMDGRLPKSTSLATLEAFYRQTRLNSSLFGKTGTWTGPGRARPCRSAAMDSHIDRLGTPGIILGKAYEILRKPDLPVGLSRYEQKPYKAMV